MDSAARLSRVPGGQDGPNACAALQPGHVQGATVHQDHHQGGARALGQVARQGLLQIPDAGITIWGGAPCWSGVKLAGAWA